MALQPLQPLLQQPRWMWLFREACPTEPRGCCVWPWDSWTGLQTSPMTGRTHVLHLSSHGCGWACDGCVPGPQGDGWVGHCGTEWSLPQLGFGRRAATGNARWVSSTEAHQSQHPAHGPVIALPPLPVVWAQEGEQGLTLMHMCPGRRTLWLNIGGKEAAALSMFQVSTPLPVVSDHATRQGRCWGAHGCVPLLLAGTS